MSVTAIVTVDEDNRVGAIKYGPYTSADAVEDNEYLIGIEFFPNEDPMGALFSSTNNTFTYDDTWTAKQAALYPPDPEPTE